MLDENTISSEEKVSSNSYVVNFFTRFDASDFVTKSFDDEMYSPNTLIVMYDTEGAACRCRQDYECRNHLRLQHHPGNGHPYPQRVRHPQWMAYLKTVKGVVSVERDRITRLTDPVKPRLEIM